MSADASDSLGELLSAYLDDEVTADERAQVERLLASDPAARALHAELRAAADAVRELPAPVAPPDVLAGIMPRLERETLLAGSGRDVTLARHRRPPVRATLAVAAMLAVALGGGLYVSLKLSERPEEPRLALRQPANEDAAPALRKPSLEVRPQSAAPAAGEAARKQGAGAPSAPPATSAAPAPAGGTPPSRSIDTNLFSESTRDALSELGITPLAVPPADTTGEAAVEPAPEPLASAASLPELLDDEAEVADVPAGEMAKTSSAAAATALASPPIAIDARTFEQRLAAGEDPAELAAHAFTNEPLRLSIHFRSSAGAERFSQRVQRLLASRNVPALGDAGSAAPAAPTPLRAPLVMRAAEAAVPPNRRLLYVVGAPGVNFPATEAGERQLLARVPADWIDDLIDETVATDAAATELQLGGLAAQGPADARTLAQTIVTPPPPMAFARATVPQDEESQWLGGLKELVHNLAAVAHPQDERDAKGLPAVAARSRLADTNGIDADSASTVGLELATAQRAAAPAPTAGRLLASNEAPAADAAVMELPQTPALAPSGSDVVTIVLDVSVEPAPADVGTNG